MNRLLCRTAAHIAFLENHTESFLIHLYQQKKQMFQYPRVSTLDSASKQKGKRTSTTLAHISRYSLLIMSKKLCTVAYSVESLNTSP
jgi:putative heme iron utilization protein